MKRSALQRARFVCARSPCPVAADADDFFLFNTSNNTLSYDADGNGAGAAVTIATFDNGDLVATDITFA